MYFFIREIIVTDKELENVCIVLVD